MPENKYNAFDNFYTDVLETEPEMADLGRVSDPSRTTFYGTAPQQQRARDWARGQYGDYYNQYMGVRGQEFSKGVDPKDMTTFTGFLEDQTKKNPFSDRYRMMTPYQRGVSTSKFAPSTRFIFY